MRRSTKDPTARQIVAVGLLLALGGAVAAAGLGYSTPMVIPASSFVPDGWWPDGYELWTTGHLRGRDGQIHLVAAVHLPDGAEVTSFRGWVYDNYDVDASPCPGLLVDVVLVLRRVHLLFGTSEVIADFSSSGDSGLVQLLEADSVTSSRAIVDNDVYAYYVDLQLCSSAHHLNSVIIGY